MQLRALCAPDAFCQAEATCVVPLGFFVLEILGVKRGGVAVYGSYIGGYRCNGSGTEMQG